MLELKRTPIQPSAVKNGTKRILLGLVLGAALAFQCHEAPASPVVDSLSYSFNATMTNSGVEPTARATVSGSLTRRGTTDNERLTIRASKLQINTTYHLVAFLDDGTTSTAVADFTTDRRGAASIVYVRSSHPGAHPFPDVLDTLSNLGELDIVNAAGDNVLQADLTDPKSFSYSVRRAMDNTGIIAGAGGVLRLSGSTHATRATVTATGLTPATSYQLLVNGVSVTTKTSDRRGRLTVSGPRTGLEMVLDIRTVELADSTGAIIILSSTGLGIPGVLSTSGQAPVVLGAAGNYAVLAGSTVTSIGNTTINGDVGVAPGSAVTGFPPGTVNGAIRFGSTAVGSAKAALTVAYNDAKGRTLAPVSVAGNIGGQTLAPGLYKSKGSLEVSSGDLTLDANGDANGVFIFQIATTLSTTPGRQVILAGNAKAANIFWQVGSSATLDTTTVFKGTIMANQSISLGTGATLEGRALARIAAVTMDSNDISIPVP